MFRCSRAPLHALVSVALATAVGVPATASTFRAEAPPADRVRVDDRTLLPRPLAGRNALQHLGGRVAEAAARNGLDAAELRELLSTDRSARLDRAGRVHYVEPVAEAPTATDALTAFRAPASLDRTFRLHSNPGADQVVFLDVDGADVSGTVWTRNADEQPAWDPAQLPAWDPAGDGPSFTADERLRVQYVWSLVAEDFAAWDVDVTTEDPGPDGEGSHVVISPDRDAMDAICGGACGGVAYLNAFGSLQGRLQPAWVFPQALGHHPKYVAEAASHEVGHNLGLEHDGSSSSSYYSGHGSWGPIMGVGYSRSIVQWSRGHYAGADNPQDDLSVIGSHLATRPDEARAGTTAAPPPPAGRAFITTPGDVDTYALGQYCSAGATVRVSPAALSPDLDVALTLRGDDGAVRMRNAPASGGGDGATASGMGARLTLPRGSRAVTVSVAGSGHGSWSTGGYDRYGSIGAYSLSVSGCGDAARPGRVDRPRLRVRGHRLVVRWRAPQATAPVDRYVVRVRGADRRTVARAGTRAVVRRLPRGRYRVRVLATNEIGRSAASPLARVRLR